MFDFIHSEQEEGWQPKGAAIATQSNPSFAQREHKGDITLPSDSIAATVRARR